MGKLISVVIPTHNRADLIKDAINTVLEQTYQNFEIIIVDDGSTDNTSDVVKRYTDFRIKYIYQANSGVSKARNNGIQNASGEYIAFLDSDDLWHPQKLEKQLSVMENDHDAGLVTTSSQYTSKRIKEYCPKSSILLNPDRVFCGTPTLFIRKKVLEQVGLFDETLNFCEDWDLFFRISLVSKIHNIPEVLTYIQSHEKSLSKVSPVSEFRDSYLRFLDKAFSNEPPPAVSKKRAYSHAHHVIGLWALRKSKDYKAARANFLKSLKNSPKKIFNAKFSAALLLSYLGKS